MRDDPLPLATLAAELMAKAARRAQPDDPELREILKDLEAVLPILRTDESHLTAPRKPATREEREAAAQQPRANA